jgi:hypothetical protein
MYHRQDYPPLCSNRTRPLAGPRTSVTHATGKERDRREQKHRSEARPGAVVGSVFVKTYQSNCLPPRKHFLSPPYHPTNIWCCFSRMRIRFTVGYPTIPGFESGIRQFLYFPVLAIPLQSTRIRIYRHRLEV